MDQLDRVPTEILGILRRAWHPDILPPDRCLVSRCPARRWNFKALPDPQQAPITVLGVDDFAFRRGRHYGTVLIDMASHRPVDMFDGRDGESLAAWCGNIQRWR
jgi:hypothetical protein